MDFSLNKLKQRLHDNRERARADAKSREVRTEILQILYGNVPKLEDNKLRTDAIVIIADEIMEVLKSGIIEK